MHKGLLLLLDIEKVFDTACIRKIINLKFPNYLVRFNQDYLSNRNFVVKVNNANSGVKHALARGFPPPRARPLFINDILKIKYSQ